ncbi:type II toxin-antitoxin system RatA family toxin [Actinophytocola sp.]|uniref:type II toxin-antitoxin system RatA family toxin n=1 Tax=Actinophytocola sp. TaxID=1872138 RepID=UPI002ED296E6
MPTVNLVLTATEVDAAECYQRLSDFARYPELTDAVRSVEVDPPGPDGAVHSRWTVLFRNGLLRWTESDTLDPVARTITFRQLTGDFETFEGQWSVHERETGCDIAFDAHFDLGIPSLAAILDPVAESTLRANILTIVRGLLGAVEPVPPSHV